MTRMTSTLFELVGLSAMAMLMGACGGIVSLGDPGDGKNPLVGDDAGGTDTGAGTPTDALVSDAGADWPGMLGGLDGSVADPGIGDFTELIWQRWWVCGSAAGGICKQEFWVNAACETYFADRDKSAVLGTLDADNCNQLMLAIKGSKLAESLQDPTPCPAGPNGGKIYELHTGGHMGPKLRKRVDSCTYAGGFDGGGPVEKYILIALKLDGLPETDLHMQMADP